MSELILTEKATATTPAAGKGTVYLKPGGGLYIKDSTGAEAPLGTAGGGGGGGVTDHGALTGLGDDDHTQYLNNARGDARYDAIGTSAAHAGSTTNPHSVTKAQVGLGSADNTSDLNKPISTATQSALDAKQATLVSATNIKTINGASVLGAGDLVVSGTGGVTDHGALTGLGDDDHTQYHTDARGDARYEALGAVAAHAGTGGTAHAAVVAAGAAGFMTGADKAKLDGITGTNTGDQTTITGNAGTATALQTARTIDGVSFNGSANITVVAPATFAATSKPTPVDADSIPLVDSAASNVLKKLTWANIKATLKTYFDTLYGALSTANNWTRQQYFGEATLTDGATINWDLALAQVAKVTLAGNRTMAAPTNLVNGGFYSLAVIQDATGSRTMTWNSVFKFTAGTAPTLTTTASGRDYFTFRSDGTNLYEQGRSQGVA